MSNDQSYNDIVLTYIFGMIWDADEFDITSPGHRALYHWSDLARNELFDPKIFLNCLHT